ncbi:hypothetical protein FRB94_008082 [Tulasnella sp. JGI-2019a]|nr:hypothetical protein FRB93_007985 [Tulasnella sp. JGI-2019a]KAG8996676.1 hypothetical protein FRB94_008082 [Tulasnella sp. JGI-2019a]KAG9026297.1 hypothetical protein FRB95_009017 [Tulasnella sp. JGI-2019a]
MHSSFFTSILALLLFATFSTAHVVGITAPATVKAGKKFNIMFQTENFIQTYSDEYVMIGAHLTTSTTCDTCIGTPLAYIDLHAQGHSDTGPGNNFLESITIPSAGLYNITATITSMISGEIGVYFFWTTVKVT